MSIPRSSKICSVFLVALFSACGSQPDARTERAATPTAARRADPPATTVHDDTKAPGTKPGPASAETTPGRTAATDPVAARETTRPGSAPPSPAGPGEPRAQAGVAAKNPPSEPPTQQKTLDKRVDGAACASAAQCLSGICEGQGCDDGALGVCQPKNRVCTMDLVPYCDCANVTFQSSSGCPRRRYAKRGACEEKAD
ncbi:MAG: hypothetical protein B7733_14385 [Myxococcales bacterium FL481]|nr:MAG: hypothetical protein B7733_14385 [Myxococcales bacterium FL481]